MILFTKFAANAHDVRCMPAVCIIYTLYMYMYITPDFCSEYGIF